jgi:hypothetical protein
VGHRFGAAAAEEGVSYPEVPVASIPWRLFPGGETGLTVDLYGGCRYTAPR